MPLIISDGTRTMSVQDWGRELGIDPATLRRRVAIGLPLSMILSRERFQNNQHTIPGANKDAVARRHPLYWTWRKMRQRCLYPTDKSTFPRYGGRGITVCKEWRESFWQFVADMGERPPGCTLDRIDNDKGYSPDNCRWATRIQQQRNKSSNRLISYGGKTLCLAEWAELLGISPTSFRYRVTKYGDQKAIEMGRKKP